MVRLVVDSSQRQASVQGVTSSQKFYEFQFQRTLNHVNGVRLAHYTMPRSWNNVITGYNDEFVFTQNGSDYTCTIAAGIYSNGTDLAAAITAGAPTTDGGLTCTYSATTGKLSFIAITNNITAVASSSDAADALLGTPPTAFTTATAVAASYQIDLMTFKYLLCQVEFGAAGTEGGCYNNTRSFTYVLPMSDAGPSELQTYYEAEAFPQRAVMTNVSMDRMQITIYPADATQFALFDFNDHDHYFVFDTVH